MNGVTLQAPPKFIQSPRIQMLAQASRHLAVSGKRNLFGGDARDVESMVYGWFGKTPPPVVERMVLGDHACWIDIGPFPERERMPSKVNGYQATGESWGRDYAFLLDHSPAEIHENERIVGEIHWEMHMVRQYVWPDSVREAGRKAREMGVGGISTGHTCPDLAIGLSRIYQQEFVDCMNYEGL